MSDWGPVFVAVMLFILLTPGLLIQIPGRNRKVEFGNFQTSVKYEFGTNSFAFDWKYEDILVLVY
ncbi:hypothetical protein HS088_TW23G00163 [Tripterygium wilfordii]|uniref:Uncharacterized protein n=1 Tax=Tripterygium wilfordii TaxID=458696 RepID=A0A7J7BU39_TRIWF|nr:hypothetical protein HS088_TW23G00163 [Tripterygium wilfordii]